ncbi:hypothetical protein BH23ACT11_BH23ACT11_04080 [soil metagenome]
MDGYMNLYSQLPPHDERAGEFLLVFSRFEFALKQLGYVRQNGTRLIVEWRRFACETTYDPTSSLAPYDKETIDLFITHPPARQVLKNDKLDWKHEKPPAKDQVTLEWLLEMLYRVRNNLFHGGKQPFEPPRDRKLLEAGLALIDLCLHLNNDLYKAYRKP